MSPLERLQAELKDARARDYVFTQPYRSDLDKALAVIEAAQARFETWNRETYAELKQALATLTQEEGSGG